MVQEEEQEEVAFDMISVTDPEEMSLVTQMLPELSAAIPTGEEKPEPEKVGQEVEEQMMVPDVISVTDGLEVLSSVTQMSPEPSAAIPTGEEKPEPEKVVQEEEQEEAFLGISVTDGLEVLSSVTQMLPYLSAAIPAGVNPTEIMGQAVKLGHEVVP